MKMAIVGTCLGLLLGSVVYAGGVELYANGKQIVSEPSVVVENEISYGPLRAVAEAVGAQVEWRQDLQAAIICRGDSCVRVKASEGIMRQNRLLLPIRKLAETLGGTVQWTGGSSPRIDITMPSS